jgi:beta-glucanase (GH16 family)
MDKRHGGPNANPRPEGEALIWSDEFDAPAATPPNPAWWKHEVGDHGWGNEELQGYTDRPANACHDGRGNLAITATLEHGRYRSARLTTKGLVEFTFGRIEARVRVPSGGGIWSAVWALGADIEQVPWPGCGEIDIMENLGRQPRRVFGTLHCPGHFGDAGTSGEHILTEDLSKDFHIFDVEWSAERIEWSIDGRSYFAATKDDLGAAWVFDHPFYLLVNVAIGGHLGGAVATGATFPNALLVDYIRVYQLAPASV